MAVTDDLLKFLAVGAVVEAHVLCARGMGWIHKKKTRNGRKEDDGRGKFGLRAATVENGVRGNNCLECNSNKELRTMNMIMNVASLYFPIPRPLRPTVHVKAGGLARLLGSGGALSITPIPHFAWPLAYRSTCSSEFKLKS